jgi:hypothetical protein
LAKAEGLRDKPAAADAMTLPGGAIISPVVRN